ncbi:MULTISPECIES: gluconate:H+ symporter [Pseudomonas]|jgi:GntP family gluconate:H+ symporter|uniref:Permease DsdX n=1 Tax=Pseudomonas yamanorum TaxID=515393 RepID=A0A143GNZ8_9PSED|nr:MULTISPECIES: gluconate:H+ symporter [Pseudomonas]MDP9058871.1 GntP family permease [Pseudomonadota bacterium]AMW85997.1 Gluconate transporter family protein [Pseudomonas yamanorum]AUO21129.1 permease DsdX [Pseudomonas sp. NC02]MBK5409569.1 permease DsdX [Pseudomonas sp. TH34]MBT1270170.1 gluconate:H+ symporter [Pseudomonas sp. VS38]|eukprot:gene22518-34456_t
MIYDFHNLFDVTLSEEYRMAASPGYWLLIYAAIAIIALIVLIARYRLNPFIVITLVSIGLALLAGMPADTIMGSYEAGVGKTLGHIALVVALGTMLGKMMAESGGAEQVARTLINRFGERNAHWAMVCIAFLVGLPLFFEVGFVLLVPIAFTVARRVGVSILMVGLPMVAGLSVVHALVPPHPAAMMAVLAYNASVGQTVLYAILIGIPTAIIAGPLYAKFIVPHIHLPAENPLERQFIDREPRTRLPSFALTMGTILLPVVLMMIGGWANLISTPGTAFNQFLLFIGNSVIALLVATLVSFWTLGLAQGFNRESILKFTNECLAPTASITLLVGAGGGLNRILVDAGVTNEILGLAHAFNLSPLVMGWLFAALMRIATGSATVAMTTASGVVAPVAMGLGYPHPELLVLATGAGSVIFSHVNDGGFWLIKEYFNMTVIQTFKTWTVLETLISVVAFGLTYGLSCIL